MPEYLSPGVYIQEVPSSLKAIEGVSTSTAAFVGNCARGPVPGFNPFANPPNPPRGDFQPAIDPTPVLVTTWGDYARLFGQPPADLSLNAYLSWAAQAFFNNGGKRLYVARVTGAGAATANVRVSTGPILRLARAPRTGDAMLYLNSLRGVANGANELTFRRIADDNQVYQATVNAFDEQAGTVTLNAALAAGDATALNPGAVYAVIAGAAVNANTGPQFIARNPGAWGNHVNVQVTCSERPTVAVTAASNTANVQVASTASFYRGAVVSVALANGHQTQVVLNILPGNVLVLNAAVNVDTNSRVRVLEIDITVADLDTNQVESYRGLTWNSTADPNLRARHYSTVINARSSLVYVQPPWGGLDALPALEDNPDLTNMPMTPRGALTPLAGGADENATPTDDQVVGIDNGPGTRSGIQSLQDVDEVSIIAAPGYTTPLIQGALISQCENLRYRFAVLDGEAEPASANVVADILRHRNAYATAYAAYYTPWLVLQDGDNTTELPPSGHVIGIYARVDDARGVWKAPANEVVNGITALQSHITTGEQDILNPAGVNCIRRFANRGTLVWGARTLSSDPDNRYVNVRRYLIFLEASLDHGTQWVVFEPNSPETWARVVNSVSAFLHSQWRDGALLGRKPEDAYYVRCDESTMSADDVLNGRLICKIGVAIVRPAEFVIFQIEQLTGFAKSSGYRSTER
jgi:phage tail sheath protein FI